ncbi:uncharacterized protein LOC143919783 [Arctopsyche grandis]|uniref:uncharacterized protein LOC143919783 n=1 Tax=Arctopsyche grandis TaxID=121162 RepID=UPI00406D7214
MFKFVVLFAALAVASAKPQYFVPSAYSAPFAYSGYAAPYAAAAPFASAYSPLAYSAPAYTAPAFAYGEPALYPGSPAGVVKSDGKLVDTTDVVVARNNHFVAKTLNAHGIHKRAAIAPIAYSHPFVSAYSSPLAYSGYSSPVVSAYSAVHPTAYSSYGYAAPHSAYGVHVL